MRAELRARAEASAFADVGPTRDTREGRTSEREVGRRVAEVLVERVGKAVERDFARLADLLRDVQLLADAPYRAVERRGGRVRVPVVHDRAHHAQPRSVGEGRILGCARVAQVDAGRVESAHRCMRLEELVPLLLRCNGERRSVGAGALDVRERATHKVRLKAPALEPLVQVHPAELLDGAQHEDLGEVRVLELDGGVEAGLAVLAARRRVGRR